MIIRSLADVIVVQTVYNFHEGSPEFKLDSNGTLSIGIDAGAHFDNLALYLISKDTIFLGFNNYGQTFTHIGSLDHFLRKEVLSGTYKGTDDKVYIFDEYGKALFPDRTFRYLVGCDHVAYYNFDYFIDLDTEQTFKFKKVGSQLEVYRILENDTGISVEDSPVLQLTKVD